MRRTKIICTIGPATETKSKINLMIKNGMNIARLNFSHGQHSWFAKTIKSIRAEAKRLNKPVAIIQDLCGPKIRLGLEPAQGLKITKGHKIILAHKPTKELLAKGNVFSCEIDLSPHLHKGQIILLHDGKAQLQVFSTSPKNKLVTFVSLSDHTLYPKKGINIPSATINIPSLTDKDISDLVFASSFQIEYIALSFVKKADDIIKLKKILEKRKIKSKIIAKIETAMAIENLDSIIEAADAIMVARGDLGLETPIHELPLIQKLIIQKCLFQNKPVIVATQMLASITDNPIPTRAEVSDIANAVYDNVDAVMLSEESATGHFPITAVNMMSKICQTTDENLYLPENSFLPIPRTTQIHSLASSACQIALDLNAKYIITPVLTGQTARILACFRPPVPIIAVTNNQTTYHQLSLIWGVTPIYVSTKKHDDLLPHIFKHLRQTKEIKKGDVCITLASSRFTSLYADQLQIKTIS